MGAERFRTGMGDSSYRCGVTQGALLHGWISRLLALRQVRDAGRRPRGPHALLARQLHRVHASVLREAPRTRTAAPPPPGASGTGGVRDWTYGRAGERGWVHGMDKAQLEAQAKRGAKVDFQSSRPKRRLFTDASNLRIINA